MNIDDKITKYKRYVEECELISTTTAVNSIREAAKKKAGDYKEALEYLESYKRLRAEKELEADIFNKIREEITKLQTYKMFPYEETVYIKRDDVLKIFDEYMTESEEEDAHSD